MTEDKKKKLEAIKDRVSKFREKHKNTGKEAKGVSKPNRSHKKTPKMVGKRGGVFTPTKGGKDYAKSLIKGKIKELVIEEQDKYKKFIEEVKMSNEIKKAVTSEAAAPEAQKPVDEAVLNAENKPTISDAKTPEQLAQEAAAAVPPAKPEVKFDHLFANDFSLGSTLKHNPQGGSVVDNSKKPKIDYVETYKNSTKNQVMTAEELAALSTKKK